MQPSFPSVDCNAGLKELKFSCPLLSHKPYCFHTLNLSSSSKNTVIFKRDAHELVFCPHESLVPHGTVPYGERYSPAQRVDELEVEMKLDPEEAQLAL